MIILYIILWYLIGIVSVFSFRYYFKEHFFSEINPCTLNELTGDLFVCIAGPIVTAMVIIGFFLRVGDDATIMTFTDMKEAFKNRGKKS